MNDSELSFLRQLLTTPGPAGFESQVQALWCERTRPFAETVQLDVHGNAYAALNSSAACRVMLAGHADEIGLMVMAIGEDGLLKVGAIGSFDCRFAPGTPVQIMSANGLIDGIIGKPLRSEDGDGGDERPPRIGQLWVDIGALDREDAARHVAAGDPMVMAPTCRSLLNNRWATRAADDRVGVFMCSEVVRRLAGKPLKVALWSVSTVQEEVGSRGARSAAFRLDPAICLVFDVVHVSDYPTADVARFGDVRLGRGPVLVRGANANAKLNGIIEAAAREAGIPYQISPVPTVTYTDANPIQMHRGGVATALIKVPVRYMHSATELFSLDDLEHATALAAATVERLDGEESFIP